MKSLTQWIGKFTSRYWFGRSVSQKAKTISMFEGAPNLHQAKIIPMYPFLISTKR